MRSIAGAALPERVSGLKVTERFFDLWGVPPALGRTLEQTDFATTNHVVVLGHAVWQRLFNRDPRVAGALVRIDGESYTVIARHAGQLPDHRQGGDLDPLDDDRG